jgi:hypothetical protein
VRQHWLYWKARLWLAAVYQPFPHATSLWSRLAVLDSISVWYSVLAARPVQGSQLCSTTDSDSATSGRQHHPDYSKSNGIASMSTAVTKHDWRIFCCATGLYES